MTTEPSTTGGDDGRDEMRSIPLSALEHYEYCTRQAALIHLDGYFTSDENTVRGDLAHAAVDRGGHGPGRIRACRSLPVWSTRLGLHGICDTVEFPAGTPVPVEHKSGVYRSGGPAGVQAAAQAMCLSEMFGTNLSRAVIFAGKDRRRHEIAITDELTRRVETATTAMRALLDTGRLPPPRHDSRCTRCSLRPGCLPEAPTASAQMFVARPMGDWRD